MAKRTADPKTVADLKFDDQNARRHGERNLGLIRESLRENGVGRSVLIDEDNRLIAGNGTVMAAPEAGVTKVRVVDADPDELIAVRRRGLTPEQKRRMALFDNRSAELAEWDPDVLQQLADADGGAALEGLFQPDELSALLDSGDDEAAPIEGLPVDRSVAVAWVLLAVPLHSWAQNQAHIEALQHASVFTTMTLRPVATEKPEKGRGAGKGR